MKLFGTYQWIGVMVFLVYLCSTHVSARLFLDNLFGKMSFRFIRNFILRISSLGPINQKHKQVPFSNDTAFPCDVHNGRSNHVPKSVHLLRPGDIDVIAGIGDSLTCGAAIKARSISETMKESRGLAFSAGGEGSWREITTLPNLLKMYNPHLTGYALRDAFSYRQESRFNVGEVGAISKDMPFMTRVLLQRMLNDPSVDMARHWKLITIMIGGNDFCTYICYYSDPYEALEEHRKDLMETLRFIKNNIPRSFVNIVPIPNLKQAFAEKFIHSEAWFSKHALCTCQFAEIFRNRQKMYDDILVKWRQVEKSVAMAKEFRGLKEFAVVYQPFTTHIRGQIQRNGRPDITPFAVDMSHPSHKGHGMAGASLFRNMLQAEWEKDFNWKDAHDAFPCPSHNHPFFKTYDNV